ncbi:MAG TPA: Uma2 family endonuclease [Pyrinomonadaceae bacterium]|nr:Uma2 family endonuclease [Pyrinomonadaceae bacterium]
MSVAEKVFEADSALVVRAGALGLTDEKFLELCLDNPNLRLEMTAKGELIVMGPTGSETGRRNSGLNFQLYFWARDDGTGICFDSSAAFKLPNGAKLSPDASWIRKERYAALTEDEREQFAPVCPDFVIELRSKTDRLSRLQAKMSEYIENGAQLGWLIDPASRRVYVYRPGQETETLDAPDEVAGDPVLPNFRLQLREIW